MKKRVACFLLSALMVLSLIPAMAFGASAASDLTTSEEGIALIKQFEGFVSKPYLDHKQYSIGYGTVCPSDKLAEYRTNGITEKEADELLRDHLAKDEKRLNTFADKNGLVLTQYQFDALMSFTYNLGSNWMNNNEGTFRTAVIDGKSGNNFLFAITQWCKASDEIHTGLVNRRLAEANLYLNGVYSKTAPEKFDYVLFDANEGTSAVEIQGYNSTVTDSVRAVPSQAGYRFLGWYTAKAGGKCITKLDASVAGETLYARWQKDEGAVDQNGTILGTPANYEIEASTLAALTIRDIPKISGESVGTLKADAKVTITAEYVDANNVKWGKTAEGGWINLSLKNIGVEDEPENVIVKITVTSSYVNIRSGAGADTAFVRRAQKGEQMEITRVRQVGNAKWGKFSEGWVCLSYTDYETALLESAPNASVVTAKGVVTTDGLRIRAGTSTSTAIMGTLNKGDEVEITLQKTVGVMKWGKIEQGWIALNYVNLTPVEPGESTDKEETPDKDETTGKDEPAEDTKPEDSKTEDTETVKPTVLATGTVYNCNTLRVRAGAGTKNAQTASLANGTKVEILEQTVVNGQPWGRIKEGWISLNYVKLDLSKEEQENALPCVVLVNGLNVRSGPGTSNAKVATLKKDTEVMLLEIVQVGKSYWGRIEQGWVHLDYLGLIAEDEEDTTKPETPGKDESADKNETTDKDETAADKAIATGVIYRCDSLRVREGAGTHTKHVSSVARGTRVEIYETTDVRGTTWGRTAGGWISLYYVQLDATIIQPDSGTTTPPTTTPPTTGDGTTTDTVIATGTIYRTTSLRVREYAGTRNKHIGDLAGGTRVNIYETVKAGGSNWARVDQGWISLYYVKLDATVTQPDSGTTTPPTTTPPATTPPTTGDDTTTDTVIATGTIYRCTSLRVREYAGTRNKHIGDLPSGTRVNIYETVKAGGSNWARVDQGWISLYYVKLDAAIVEPEAPSTTPETPSAGTDTEKDPTTEPDKDTTTGTETEKEPTTDTGSTGTTTESGTLEITLTGTIVKTDSVTVRSAAGVKNDSVGSLKRGDRIQIVELATIPGGAMWGRTSGGWVHMYYVQLDETNESIKVVNTDNLRIREAAGTKNSQVGTYTRGTMIIILETTTVDGDTWGRTDKGWVCMDYVK